MRRAAALAAAALLLAPAADAARPAARPVTTLAIVGDAGLNPLHADFRTRDGRDPVYPSGMPTPVRVPLPRAETWEQAADELRAGPLGDPQPGRLYALEGTRVLLYATPGTHLLIDDAHGTGTASAAVGRSAGTSPESLVVLVPGGGDAAYDWVAAQRWIDVASTSAYEVRTLHSQCGGAAGARALHRDGGLLFSSSGNTTDALEPLSTPNGLPEVFQVGGVDRTGRTWIAPRPEEPEPLLAVASVIRPYETGARFSMRAAAARSFDGTQPFGGTSAASPTVAGYAAELVAEARRLTGDRRHRTDRALAQGRRTRTGPLADGRFTRDELVDLLHATATPAESGPHRYLLEGFGATTDRSHALALQVLRGRTDLLARPDDQARHAQVEDLRARHTARC